MRLTLVVARARNGVIGRDGALPWRMPSDLKHFKAATLGKPILMGRRTWDSLSRALPGRANMVVTRNARFRARGAHVHSDLDAAIAAAGAISAASGQGEVCVIGGASLYAETLPRATRILMTEIDLAPEGDAHFPPFDEAAFRETARIPLPRTEKDDADAIVRVLDRI
jgi:dihydrofolate reductase